MNWADVLRIVTAALVAGLGAGGVKLGRHVREIHVLVNSNLSEIKQQLASMTQQRDDLRADAADHVGEHRSG